MDPMFKKMVSRPVLMQAYDEALGELQTYSLRGTPVHVMKNHLDGFLLKRTGGVGLFTEANVIDVLTYFKDEPVKRIDAVERVLVLAIKEKPDLGPAVFSVLVDPAYQEGFLFDYQYYRLLGSVAREMALKERMHPALYYDVKEGVPNIDVFVVNLQNAPAVLFNQQPAYVPILPEKLLSNCDLNIVEHWPKYKDRLNASLRLLFSFTKDRMNGAVDNAQENPGLYGAAASIENWRTMAQQMTEYPRLERELEPGVRKMLQAYAPAPK